MAESPMLVRLYSFGSVPVILYLSAIDVAGAMSLFLVLTALLLAVSWGLLRRSRIAWLVAMVFPAVAMWLSLLVFDRYNSPSSVPGTVTVWDPSNTVMSVFAIAGLVALLWPSTWRWFWRGRDSQAEGSPAAV